MKKLNEFISKLQKLPLAQAELNMYGKGKIVQVIMAEIGNKDNTFEMKENVIPSIAMNNLKDNSNVDLIEIAYDTIAEKKLYSRTLVDELVERFTGKYVYVSYLQQTKNELLMQFYVFDELNKFN